MQSLLMQTGKRKLGDNFSARTNCPLISHGSYGIECASSSTGSKELAKWWHAEIHSHSVSGCINRKQPDDNYMVVRKGVEGRR